MTAKESAALVSVAFNMLESEWYCDDDWSDVHEARDMAISALEKQIPKKVRVTTSTKRCSVCGRQLSGIGNIHPKRNYCQKCGQAIDWEGET